MRTRRRVTALDEVARPGPGPPAARRPEPHVHGRQLHRRAHRGRRRAVDPRIDDRL